MKAEASFNQGYAHHISGTMMVFINPEVAGLPQHAHLFGGHGCYNGAFVNTDGGQARTGADELPARYSALHECRKEKVDKGAKPGWICPTIVNTLPPLHE